MRLRPEFENVNRWEEDRKEGDRVLERFGIKHPRCGFGIGKGWIPTVERALEKMVAAGWDKDLHQVKQKFCGLRIYIGTGAYDDVDNPVKRLVRTGVHKLACLFSFKNRFTKLIASLLFKLRDSSLLCQWRPNAIAEAIDEAETECNDLCERCGKEREKKGFDWGMALCSACGVPTNRKGQVE